MELDPDDIPTTDVPDTNAQQASQQRLPLRSSARVRAVKEKEQLQQTVAEFSVATASSSTALSPTASLSAKAKGKQRAAPEPIATRASKRVKTSSGPVTASGIVINEPPKDIKGKKRAEPEPDSSSDEQSLPPPQKRTRQPITTNGASSSTTGYALRPRKPITNAVPSKPQTMGKKNKANVKSKTGGVKGKANTSIPGPSNVTHDGSDVDIHSSAPSGDDCEADRAHDRVQDDEEHTDDDEGNEPQETSAPNSGAVDGPAGGPASGPPPGDAPSTGLGGLDASTAAALFGSDYRAIGSYMMTLSSRLKTILENIKPAADPLVRLTALQELTEILSMSTEDTLSGYFQMDSFVRELVKIMGGTGNTEDDTGEDDDDEQEQDEDAALAAALALSQGGLVSAESLEAQMLACRCLANLMEALPGCAHTIVYHGAVPVLCSKLTEISYIDLAEQALSTLEKISEEYPSAIIREGGLSALLNYIDFFSTNVQRTALRAASNCCKNVTPDHFQQIRDVFPIIRNVLAYSDQRLVEYACLCVIRVIESYYRSSPDNLDTILDQPTIKAINVLLLPAGGSPLVSSATYTSFLKVLAAAAKASPKTTLGLLDADIVSTLYQILTGVLPPTQPDHGEQGNAPGGQGLGGGLADMTVMQNLAHRPKDQVEEALSLVSELMPPLPKDGVFDPKAYSEKAFARMVKAKNKADRAAARGNLPAVSAASKSNVPLENVAGPSSSSSALPDAVISGPEETVEGVAAAAAASNQMQVDEQGDEQSRAASVAGEASDLLVAPGTSTEGSSANASREKEKDRHAVRISMLKERSDLVLDFMKSIVPILVDVYAASVAPQVRARSLTGILKATSWLDGDSLDIVLKNVPMASFVGSILSSKESPVLVIPVLQVVETLLSKLHHQYRKAFRREGVLHELEGRAVQDLSTKPVASPPTPPAPIEAPTAISPSVTAPWTSADAPPESQAETSTTADASDSSVNAFGDGLPPPSVIAAMIPPPTKRSSSTPINPDDAVIMRCRVIKFKYLSAPSQSQEGDPFEAMQSLGRRLAYGQANEAGIRRTLIEVAALFTTSKGSISSFELIRSGLVDELLELTTIEGRKVDLPTRQRIFLEVFSNKSPDGTDSPTSLSGLAVLVKRLQESLTRLEAYEVVTASQGDDSKRGATNMLARQLRLKLIAAEGTVVPKHCTNITVSIHAIATFQALHDYLRPRVAGVGPGSRLGGVMAALAAAAGVSPEALRTSLGVPAAIGSSSSLPVPPNASGSKTPQEQPGSSNAAGPSTASAPPQAAKRRSLRLSKKKSDVAIDVTPGTADNAPEGTAATSSTAAASAAAALLADPSSALSTLMNDLMDEEDDYIGDDFDAEVPDHPEGGDMNERTVSLAVADDGAKVVAQTPDGTRVATPNPPTPAPAPLHSKFSYASALKAKPLDWHLEFSINDTPIPLDMTVYGAVYHNVFRKGNASMPISSIMNATYVVKFKKVSGPASADLPSDSAPTERAPSPMSTTAPDDAPHAKILRLLRILRKLNAQGGERLAFDGVMQTLPEAAFINNKLTAKLTRQLEEPLILASSCLPDWALDLPQHYPFLFPFATRFAFLQSTSFGYARLIAKWQGQQPRSNDRRDDLGRPQRQKVRISRNHLLESATKVLELYGSSASVLEVEYYDEVGTGLGPTLEFYSLVSKEFARKDLKVWHDADPMGNSQHVAHPRGLYPAPLHRSEIMDPTSVTGKKRAEALKLLGQFIGKALLDSRIIDVSMNKIFLKHVLGEDIPMTIASLKMVDHQLASSLAKLQVYADIKRDIEANFTTTPAARSAALSCIDVDGVKLEDLSLDFTVPGYDIELKDGGRNIAVEPSNVEEYIKDVLEVFLGRSVQFQAQAFRDGFSKVFPVTDLQTFSSDELAMMFGTEEEDWSAETLNESIKADHGFHIESRAIRDLLEVMISFDTAKRRQFLQFITGSPRLPVGGFRGLNPPLTVVRKPHEAPLSADDYLPSVMTCVNYLKLPEYSSREVMAAKLQTAINEGVGSFHLS